MVELLSDSEGGFAWSGVAVEIGFKSRDFVDKTTWIFEFGLEKGVCHSYVSCLESHVAEGFGRRDVYITERFPRAFVVFGERSEERVE